MKKQPLIIGERINASVTKVERIITAKDIQTLQTLVLKQIAQGAEMLDVNSDRPGTAEKDMEWLVKEIQKVSTVPLCLDSSSPETIKAGLRVYDFSLGLPFLNSATIKREKLEKISALAIRFNCGVIALATLGKKESPSKRIKMARDLLEGLVNKGVSKEKIFIDPGVYPVAIDPSQPLITLKVIKELKTLKVKTVCAPSNVSFGLPKRKLLNKVFINMLKKTGVDALIVDPRDLVAEISKEDLKIAQFTLGGNDKGCKTYLQYIRSERLSK